MAAPMNPKRREALVKGASRAKIKALVNLEACTGCEVCISACPVPTCIEPFGGDDINLRGVYVDYDLCIGCKLCVKDCPWDTIYMVPREQVDGHTTSIESQPHKAHPIFEQPAALKDERVRGPVEKLARQGA